MNLANVQTTLRHDENSLKFVFDFFTRKVFVLIPALSKALSFVENRYYWLSSVNSQVVW